MNRGDIQDLLNVRDRKPIYFTRTHLTEYIEEKIAELDAGGGEDEKPKGTRSGAQNRSLHLWLTQVAQELDKEGHTIQNVVAKIQRAEIRPTGENLKEVLWRPYMLAATGKESTTKLDKAEVDRIYEGLNKFLGEHFHIHIPFPSDEARQLENLAGYMTAVGTEDVPEIDETNRADKF